MNLLVHYAGDWRATWVHPDEESAITAFEGGPSKTVSEQGIPVSASAVDVLQRILNELHQFRVEETEGPLEASHRAYAISTTVTRIAEENPARRYIRIFNANTTAANVVFVVLGKQGRNVVSGQATQYLPIEGLGSLTLDGDSIFEGEVWMISDTGTRNVSVAEF